MTLHSIGWTVLQTSLLVILTIVGLGSVLYGVMLSMPTQSTIYWQDNDPGRFVWLSGELIIGLESNADSAALNKIIADYQGKSRGTFTFPDGDMSIVLWFPEDVPPESPMLLDDIAEQIRHIRGVKTVNRNGGIF